jgi:hypothetical protein
MSGGDSTKSDHIALLDAGSHRWQLRTSYNPVDLVHQPLVENIDFEHQRVHEGRAFIASNLISGIASGGSYKLLIKNTNGETPHLRVYEFESTGGPLDVLLYKNPTVTDNGTLETNHNKNQTSTNTSSIEVYKGTTTSADGTLLETKLIPSGGNKVGGLATNAGGEWILEEATDYLFVINNDDNSAVDVSFYFFWYERNLT